MGNALRGEAELSAGGEVYRIAFDWNAGAEYEEVRGKPLSDALLEIDDGKISARSLRAMLWAGLRRHHAKVSLAQAGELIGVVGRREALRVMGTALRYFYPELEPKPEGAEGGSPPGEGPPLGGPASTAPSPR